MVTTTQAYFRTPNWLWAALAACALMIFVAFWNPIVVLFDAWFARPEYSHGIVIPVLSAYLLYQRRHLLVSVQFNGSWLGTLLTLLGCLIWLVGELSTIYAVTQFALVLVIGGVALSWVGAREFKHVAVPVGLLFFMIPLPAFLHNNFSSMAQLASSEIGVGILRLFGVSVFLEGNVIDLGHFQMQVVEACDGLRYLFPMMTLGLIIAYFYRGKLWQRAFVFLSTLPITVLMNSARIAMIGLFAENGNTTLAEGVLHDMQGWAMFMLSTAIVIGEVWVFTRLDKNKPALRDAFDFGDTRPQTPRGRHLSERRLPVPLAVSAAVLFLTTATAVALPARTEIQPAREYCVTFPTTFGQYTGERRPLESAFENALKVDDYLLADFRGHDGVPINLWLAYYGSQRKGQSAHSPRSCLPGGGWRIESLNRVPLPGGPDAAHVNRAVIAKGNQRQLVYYWFKQRDRWLTGELSVKWYILVDALTRNRSDGALIRLVTPVADGEPMDLADRRLADFAGHVQAQLGRYVPD